MKLFNFLKKIKIPFLSSRNAKLLKRYGSVLKKINKLESEFRSMSRDEMMEEISNIKSILSKSKTKYSREFPIKNFENYIIRVFGIVREAAYRTIKLRHHDVQILGGLALLEGKIAEMKTGEGKTLVATLPAAFHALFERGVHIITVNEYLSKRDYNWMKNIYDYIGLKTGLVGGSETREEKKLAYLADITYVTNHNLGFDYLGDQISYSPDQQILIGRYRYSDFPYCIIDEADCILIDEARTPLIISSATRIQSDLYKTFDKIAKSLSSDDYAIDEKRRSIELSESGSDKVEKALILNGMIKQSTSIYSIECCEMLHHAIQSLKANYLFTKDKDYILKNNSVLIVDEFTGRISDGRRYSDGLHQALEAKESVQIHPENKTAASITYQSLFRMYSIKSGMTGTAMTEKSELDDIYNMEVVQVPTHRPVIRKDHDDLVFMTKDEKNEKIIEIIKKCHSIGQPVLVGTSSINSSEEISNLLSRQNIKHTVLNAKHHEKEARIIAEAGRYKAVTIATNMAGRGTDIILGGDLDRAIKDAVQGVEDESEIKKIEKKIIEEHSAERERVIKAGGLFVLGSERNESQRIDNQLKGRSGRCGDVGESMFVLSLEDELIRIFMSQPIINMIKKMSSGADAKEPLTHPLISSSISRAQRRMEEMNYEIRKNIIKYETQINNAQRQMFFSHRNSVLHSKNAESIMEALVEESCEFMFDIYLKNELNFLKFSEEISSFFLPDQLKELVKEMGEVKNNPSHEKEMFMEKCKLAINKLIESKSINCGDKDLFEFAIKRIALISMDEAWQNHIYYLDHIKSGIHLRAYAQKDPLNEYKMESIKMFTRCMQVSGMNSISRILMSQYKKEADNDQKRSKVKKGKSNKKNRK